LRLLDFLFHKEESDASAPADGYMGQPPHGNSIVHPGTYKFRNRQVDVLGFTESGHIMATIFLCHAGSGKCSEWGTFEFVMLSCDHAEEIWEHTVGKSGIVIHAIRHDEKTKIKIEVDR